MIFLTKSKQLEWVRDYLDRMVYGDLEDIYARWEKLAGEHNTHLAPKKPSMEQLRKMLMILEKTGEIVRDRWRPNRFAYLHTKVITYFRTGGPYILGK